MYTNLRKIQMWPVSSWNMTRLERSRRGSERILNNLLRWWRSKVTRHDCSPSQSESEIFLAKMKMHRQHVEKANRSNFPCLMPWEVAMVTREAGEARTRQGWGKLFW